MAQTARDTVRRSLQAYAVRGVLRSFDEVPAKGSQTRFRFLWHGDRPLDLSVDTRSGTLRFNNLLPNLPSDSVLYAELKRFLKLRTSTDLPVHRRIDARRAELGCFNRGGNVSIALKVRNNEYAYGVKRLVNLVHEMFVELNASWAEYMNENFDARQD